MTNSEKSNLTTVYTILTAVFLLCVTQLHRPSVETFARYLAFWAERYHILKEEWLLLPGSLTNELYLYYVLVYAEKSIGTTKHQYRIATPANLNW